MAKEIKVDAKLMVVLWKIFLLRGKECYIKRVPFPLNCLYFGARLYEDVILGDAAEMRLLETSLKKETNTLMMKEQKNVK